MENNNHKRKFRAKHSFFQKHKSYPKKQENREDVYSNQSEEKEPNGRNSEAIIITEIRLNDSRRRDIDGMVATILDCLVGANILKDDCIGQVDSVIAHSCRTGKSESGFRVVLIEKVE